MNMKVILVTGFLGSGKTSLINYLIPRLLKDNSLAIIENEFGDVNIDGKVLGKHDVEIKELSSGCICCTLQGNLVTAIETIYEEVAPDYLIMEPSGIAKTSDILKTMKLLEERDLLEVHKVINIVDTRDFLDFVDDFGDFFKDQIVNSDIICLSHIDSILNDDIEDIIFKIKELNSDVLIIKDDFVDTIDDGIYEKIKESRELVKLIDDNLNFPIEMFSSITIKLSKDESKFKMKIEKLVEKHPNILRIKGFFTENNKKYHLEYTRGNLVINEIENSLEDYIVVIGTYLEKDKIIEFLDKK